MPSPGTRWRFYSLLGRRGTSAGAIVLFLLLVLMSMGVEGERNSTFAIHSIGPDYVTQIPDPGQQQRYMEAPLQLPAGRDLLFGIAVSHVLVLSVLYLSLTGWFLLGLIRNTKRDPSCTKYIRPSKHLVL